MKRCFLLISFLIMAINATPQSEDSFDSLWQKAAEADSDTLRAKYYVQIAAQSCEPDTIVKYSNLAMEIAKRYDDKWTLMVCYDNLGWVQYYKYQFNESVESYNKSIEYAKQLDDKHFIGTTSLSLGNVYYELSEMSKMWESYYRSLDMFEQIKDTSLSCIVIRTIGQAFASVNMYKSAQEQYHKSLALSSKMRDTMQMACDYRNIGETYLQQFGDKSTRSALQSVVTAKKYLKIAERMLPDVNDDYIKSERVSNFISLANCYIILSQMEKNTIYVDSCRYYVDLFKKYNISETESNLLASQAEADVLMLEKKYQQALPLLTDALQNAMEEGSEHNQMSISKRLSECYEQVGDVSKALSSLKRHYELKLKISNETEMRRASEYIAQQQIKEEKDLIVQEGIRSEERRHRQTVINIALCVIILMMTVIVALVLKAFRQKRISNDALMEKNSLLAQQKEEIADQKEKLAYTNNQMRESITYAQRIQRTVVSSQQEMDAIFPDNFVLYRARDIVSGDFYRIDTIREHKIIVVADCTGHGVPGALLSMMGISALKDILGHLEITGGEIQPAAILQRLRNFVKQTFNKNDPKYANDDGMDMSICVIRPDGVTMDFAGANQSVVIVHDGVPKRLKGDFMPIGNYVRETDFTTQTVAMERGDMLYLFTDGIQDQLGGAEFGKFSTKRLTERLAAISNETPSQQMYDIEKDIELWIGQNAQLDDITLLGVRL